MINQNHVLDVDVLLLYVVPDHVKTQRTNNYAILWVTTQTQLFYFNPPPKKKSGAGEWPKLFREINVLNNKVVSL